jgi:PAS domain S-box-containing protein
MTDLGEKSGTDVQVPGQASVHLQRLNRVLQIARGISRLILTEKDRAALISAICTNMVKPRNYQGAWILLFDEKMKPTHIAQSGISNGFADLERNLMRGDFPACIRSAMEASGVTVVRNLEALCETCPMIHACVGFGALSIALRRQHRLHGVLTVAVDLAFVDDQEEHLLLEQVAQDIAFALHNLEMEEEHEWLLRAIEQSSEVIYITDPHGVIQYANPALETATGYRLNEIIGQQPRILKSGQQDEAYYRKFWETIKAGKTWQGPFVNRRKDGSYYTVESTVFPVRDDHGRIVSYVSVNRDITRELQEREEKARLEEQLAQAHKLESIGRLAGGVAHDFNNTLQIILGYTDAVLNEPGASSIIRNAVEEMQRAAQRSAGLTRQLLAFARQQTVTPRVMDINNAIDSTLKMLQRLLGEDIQMSLTLSPQPAMVRIDPVQMDQVLANLAVNSRDAIAGHGTLAIETSIRDLDDLQAREFSEGIPGRYVVLSVSDNGCGMDEQVMARIFEPFFTTKEAGLGTGLGLSTVYGIVKQNNGFISVTSQPGAGSRFEIFLPRTDETAPPKSPALAAPSHHAAQGVGTILVVEDEQSILATVRHFLEHAGYRVLTTGDPMHAIQQACEEGVSIDLLLSDVVMPGMSGRDLAMKLASLHPRIKFLFMSGYPADIIAHNGVIDQSLAFLAKPFTRSELLAKVRETLAAV